MKPRFATAATALAALLLGSSGCLQPTTEGSPEVAVHVEGEEIRLSPAGIRQARLQLVEVRPEIDTTRQLAPALLAPDETRTSRIGSVVEGRVLEVAVSVGDRVTAGQLLASIHSHVIHDAWADLRKARAQVRRAESELAYAEQAAARMDRLLAAGAVSLREVQRAAADLVAANEEKRLQQAEVRRAEEGLLHLGMSPADEPASGEEAEIPIRAPLGGAILERQVTTGTAVTPGVPLFVVSDLSTLWALAEVEDVHLPGLATDAEVTLEVSAYPGQTFSARVQRVGDTLDPRTRRVTVRCEVPNPGERLKPGMFASMSMGGHGAPVAAAIPEAAVQEMDGETVVFVETAPGTFRRRRVVTGREAPTWIEIVNGVTAGERVVGTGSFLLKAEFQRSRQPLED